ncbi:unnamed protein product [Linum trigynum]|uniref:CCHC-type domain-containing protein n=1 Tax=Linum trigynum TaxID=586398 RepID=A0AAV2FZU7_9ROSI
MDYEQTAAGGPWMIGGHYLTVRPWRKGFNPKTAEVASTMVWARFTGIPIEFINTEVVERIASKIGRPVKVDRPTQNGDMGRFARVCVEVYLTNPLLSQFKIEGLTYCIEFEGLHQICTECGRYGHTVKTCPSLFKQPEKQLEKEQIELEEAAPKAPNPPKVYVEWMVAKPRSRKSVSKRTDITKIGQTQPPQSSRPSSGTRFDVLVEEEEEEEEEEEIGTPGTEVLAQDGLQGEVMMTDITIVEAPRVSTSEKPVEVPDSGVVQVANAKASMLTTKTIDKLVTVPVIQSVALPKEVSSNGMKHNKGQGKKRGETRGGSSVSA